MAAKLLKLEIEFLLPEGVTNMAEIFLRLGIRIKQLATEGKGIQASRLLIVSRVI